MRGIHRWPVNSPHKGQWRGALVCSVICAWINGWVINRDAGDLRRHRAHYDVTVIQRWHFFLDIQSYVTSIEVCELLKNHPFCYDKNTNALSPLVLKRRTTLQIALRNIADKIHWHFSQMFSCICFSHKTIIVDYLYKTRYAEIGLLLNFNARLYQKLSTTSILLMRTIFTYLCVCCNYRTWGHASDVNSNTAWE